MKFLIFSGAVFLAGCATQIPYSNEEVCAIDNMKFSNLEKHDFVTVYRNSSEHAPIVAKQEELVPRCNEAKTSAEKHHVQNLRAELEPKIEYNEHFVKSQTEHDKALAASNEIISRVPAMQATFPKDE